MCSCIGVCVCVRTIYNIHRAELVMSGSCKSSAYMWLNPCAARSSSHSLAPLDWPKKHAHLLRQSCPHPQHERLHCTTLLRTSDSEYIWPCTSSAKEWVWRVVKQVACFFGQVSDAAVHEFTNRHPDITEGLDPQHTGWHGGWWAGMQQAAWTAKALVCEALSANGLGSGWGVAGTGRERVTHSHTGALQQSPGQ
jgi:hypothetical protein